MYAWTPIFEAVPSPIPSSGLLFDATPLAAIAVLAVAVVAGLGLGTLTRFRRRPWTPIGFDATPRPAGAGA